MVEKQLFQQWAAMGRQAQQLKLDSLVPIKGVWHYIQPWLGGKKRKKKVGDRHSSASAVPHEWLPPITCYYLVLLKRRYTW